MASRWFLRNVSHRFKGSGSLGARRIHRETPFNGQKSVLSRKNHITERRAVLPAQDQNLPGRMVSQRLRDCESPSRKAAAPELQTILMNTLPARPCKTSQKGFGASRASPTLRKSSLLISQRSAFQERTGG